MAIIGPSNHSVYTYVNQIISIDAGELPVAPHASCQLSRHSLATGRAGGAVNLHAPAVCGLTGAAGLRWSWAELEATIIEFVCGD